MALGQHQRAVGTLVLLMAALAGCASPAAPADDLFLQRPPAADYGLVARPMAALPQHPPRRWTAAGPFFYPFIGLPLDVVDIPFGVADRVPLVGFVTDSAYTLSLLSPISHAADPQLLSDHWYLGWLAGHTPKFWTFFPHWHAWVHAVDKEKLAQLKDRADEHNGELSAIEALEETYRQLAAAAGSQAAAPQDPGLAFQTNKERIAALEDALLNLAERGFADPSVGFTALVNAVRPPSEGAGSDPTRGSLDRIFTRAAGKHPDVPGLWLARARMAGAPGRTPAEGDATATVLRMGLAFNPRSPAILSELAFSCLKARDCGAAESYFARVAHETNADADTRADALIYEGFALYLNGGTFAQCTQLHAEAVAIAPYKRRAADSAMATAMMTLVADLADQAVRLQTFHITGAAYVGDSGDGTWGTVYDPTLPEEQTRRAFDGDLFRRALASALTRREQTSGELTRLLESSAASPSGEAARQAHDVLELLKAYPPAGG